MSNCVILANPLKENTVRTQSNERWRSFKAINCRKAMLFIALIKMRISSVVQCRLFSCVKLLLALLLYLRTVTLF